MWYRKRKSLPLRIDWPWRCNFWKHSQPSFWAVGEKNSISDQQTWRRGKAAMGSFKFSSKITRRRGRRCEPELHIVSKATEKSSQLNRTGRHVQTERRSQTWRLSWRPQTNRNSGVFAALFNDQKWRKIEFCNRQKVFFRKACCLTNTSGTEPNSNVRHQI